MIEVYIVEKGKKYQHFNDIMGAVTGCVLELERRFKGKYEYQTDILAKVYGRYYEEVVGKYEDEKIKLNGDVI
ncbi:hypothetical protein LCGC14_2448250 [marine sediment metagenome]|uniref:Uncharacterized protein n=1 Tax=marine sediment metagenome TaxID=412755 RepID=A0A0F9BGY8_9ZZZZ